MALVIEDPKTESLARQMALAEGLSVDEIVRESIAFRASRRTRGAGPAQRPLRERLVELAREVDALPAKQPADPRSDEEILGYNEHGLW